MTTRRSGTSEEMEALVQSSLGQVLMRCARLWNEETIAHAREALGLKSLRVAHTQVFPFIRWDGVRQTEIAERLDISKQAVGKLVDELVAMGALERVPDPRDGRAKLVRWSRGGIGIGAGLELLKEIERRAVAELGSESVQRLHDTLISLQGVLESIQQERLNRRD